MTSSTVTNKVGDAPVLEPRTGNQKSNKRRALKFISKWQNYADFLKEEGRIKGFEKVGADTKGNTVWKIVYN